MFNISSRPPIYDQEAVQPMRDELLAVGFEELLTPEDVDNAIKNNDDKTVLIFINSVCGCAAGSARPGISLALQNNIIPDKLYTSFAGQERDAVDYIREHIKGFPPSSPSIALFKNGELIHFFPRFDIEGYTAGQIAENVKRVFNEKCSAKGPSISPEQLSEVFYAKQCGSKIPLFKG
ncbi:MAG: BrxA/BrxB family bacilliredoxin [Ignavibacteriota bacterium]|jgi:putative YphP/YqiW family bacilliredoxin|nr:MAG: BrxA/BrxB family bacilliredoxin [Ignavibacterium sp.]MBL1155886.1 BrxA/BrxB family bacilliredoxin [Ignavibacteriota bacterium]MCZ2267889.1 BrxA/BrxB family bacilliredoxin [Ignavibacteriales bacterium]MDX9713593.1 BrxA/BrxB family bacilliredoxin [Ignavibacteriaceae bacterium]MBW7842866.1 BrxA/BrxB family bacilliredoxin [Ignavibacterium sp.]